MTATPVPNSAGRVYLLDGTVLHAPVPEAHVHHTPARRWLVDLDGDSATCLVAQGMLVHLAIRLRGQTVEQALAVLQAVTGVTGHRFWPNALAYHQIRWHGVLGHRQVTAAYLAALARHNRGMLASLDMGLCCCIRMWVEGLRTSARARSDFLCALLGERRLSRLQVAMRFQAQPRTQMELGITMKVPTRHAQRVTNCRNPAARNASPSSRGLWRA